MVGSPILAAVYILWLAVFGVAIGALEGLLLAVAMRTKKRAVWRDALLGASGMIGGFLLTALVLFPRNTIVYKVDATVVSSTMDRFQHPYWVGFALAATLPMIRAWWLKRRRQAIIP